MSQHKWLILTALAMEARAISTELGGLLADRGVGLHVIGIRAGRMNRDLLNGIDGGIILAGLAGGLDPTLMVGEVVLDGPDDPSIPSPFRRGRIHASDHLVSTVEEKQRLFAETRCLAADMESAVVRALAESVALPMFHIRSISDTADEVVPAEMLSWIDDVGEPRLSKVAGSLALHPLQIPALIRLAGNTRLANRRMAHAVRRIVEARINS